MKRIAKYICIIILLIMYSCQNDDGTDTYPQGSNENTNQWMYEQMKRYYYWNMEMPGKGDLSQAPADYFEYLLHPEDRFSYAIKPNDPDTYPKSLRNSFGLDMAFVEFEGNTYGVLLYALADSPAYYAGLQRGDLVTKVNGANITTGNYEALYSEMSHATSAQLEIVTYAVQSGFSQPHDISLNNGVILLQPVRSRIIHKQNHTVGYIEIPHFDVGLAQPLLAAFTAFKSQGVDEVVVDLRYNGGGDVSSATALCALLAPNILANEIFIHFEGNNNGGSIDQTFQQTLEMNEQQVSFGALRAAHPDIQRVYILCGNRSASASEIVINNLAPFMEVITIGETTLGKDTATFPITDDRDTPEADKWVLYPAIYKLSNANGHGNYMSGLQPLVAEDELANLPILPLGEEEEILLNRALAMISGNERLSAGKNSKVLPYNKSGDSQNIIAILPNRP